MKTVVVFSGAGLSADSGIATFRDSGGLWENHNVRDVATPQGWKTNPELVLQFYAERFRAARDAKPNAAHFALGRLSKYYNVINITQNIDNLLERAGNREVRHLHGDLFSAKCSSHKCPNVMHIFQPIRMGDKCPLCDSQMRPNVVWFGEAVNMGKGKLRSLAWHMSNEGGTFVSVGTSARVYPAASTLDIFDRVRNKYFVDLNPTDRQGFINLTDKASEAIPMLVSQLIYK